MKYIIYCGPGIGDWILILPMARRIKLSDSKAYITVIMTSDKNKFKLNHTLFALQNDIDDIDYYSVHELKHTIRFLFHIGFKKNDYGFVLQYTDNRTTSKWPGKIIHFSAKKTCGIKLTEKLNVHYDYEIARKEGTHIVDYPMMMLDMVGIGEKHLIKENLLNKDKIQKEFFALNINCPTGKIISLVVGAASVYGIVNNKKINNSAKNWPYGKWGQLAKRMSDSGYQVLLLGGSKEKDELKSSVSFENNKKIINLCGRCNILQSMSALCHSVLVIGADTGLMHCAGALGVPLLTLFGCTNYREYLPYGKKSYYIASSKSCSPCFGTEKSLTCKNISCMEEISVEQVYKRALEIISFEDEDICS